MCWYKHCVVVCWYKHCVVVWWCVGISTMCCFKHCGMYLYCLLCICFFQVGTVSFIEQVTHENLNISEEEYNRLARVMCSLVFLVYSNFVSSSGKWELWLVTLYLMPF